MAKLTDPQKNLLALVAHVKNLSIYGPREWRTAKALERKGLIHIDHHDIATLRAPQ